ncbi:GAF domain-containing protein [Thermoleptolyngbya sichuanensis XZ-Cy5]|uniref:GAF domain-containing protein n=1 Tax=Thermoleptolyngbya sichuanensis TaxID=2885951 RepID=UPI00240CE704|nr:GAF domain-containing protein [Thermoleptolyngbya sichuanensis]MDG2615212.1 GAF domain-containing protein [Thermoleptolyngbya sichuanensis XZ-Cy5]
MTEGIPFRNQLSSENIASRNPADPLFAACPPPAGDSFLLPPITAVAQTLVVEAVRLMHEAESGYIAVLQQGQLLGLFTAQDLVRAIAQGIDLSATQIGDLVQRSPVVITEAEWNALVSTSPPPRADHVAVTDSDGQLLGVVTLNLLTGTAQEPQSYYRQLVDHSPNPIFWVNRAGLILNWNPACERMFQDGQTMLGRSLQDLMPSPALWNAVQTMVEQVFEGQSLANVELTFQCQDGTESLMLACLYPLMDDQGQIEACIFANTDITEYKRLAIALQQREKDLSDAQRLARLGSWEYNVQTQTVRWSEQTYRIFGLDPAQSPTYRTLRRLIHPADVRSFEQFVKRAIATGAAYDHEMRIVLPDGSIRHLHNWGQAIVEQGRTVRLFGTMQDITERKQAEQRLQQQTQRERLIAQIAQRIRQSLDSSEVLSITVEEVRQFLQADRVLIYQFRPDWSGRVVVESVGRADWTLCDRVIDDPCFRENWQQPYQQGRIRAIDNIHTADIKPCHRDFLLQLQVTANLIVPILVQKQLWGLLLVHQCCGPRQWQVWECELLLQLANQVGIAIQQSELYHQVQQLNHSLSAQVQQQTAQLKKALDFEKLLKRITDKVRDSLDEDVILQKVVQELGTGLGVSICDTGLYDLEQNISIIQYEYVAPNIPSRYASIVSIRDYADLYEQLFQRQIVHFCWRVLPRASAGDGLENQNAQPILRDMNQPFTVLACLLRDNQSLLGDLWLYRAGNEPFGESEIRLVEQVANQCAIAIRQARLYQAARNQVEKLEQLNELKDNFLSSVSHELRTPMANVKMSSQMLELSLRQLGLFDNPDLHHIHRYFQILKDECQRELKLINDLLDLSRLDAGMEPLLLTSIHLCDWVAHIAEPFLERTRTRNQHLSLNVSASLPPIRTDASYLSRILGELLNNACKYTPDQGTIQVIASEYTAEYLRIVITNTGVEIPTSEQERVFERFYRVPSNDPWNHEGTGLGLALVKKLIERLGGAIALESHDNFVRFTLTLPVALHDSQTLFAD